MKRKGLFFALGLVSVLSCGAISFSHNIKEVRADSVIDLGEISFSLNVGTNERRTATGIYIVSATTNEMTTNWEQGLYSNEANAVLRNGNAVCTPTLPLKKVGAQSYYLGLSDVPSLKGRIAGEKFTIQGNWQGTVNGVAYKLSVKKFEATWDGTRWNEEFVIPDLEEYDEVTLVNAGYDDFDRVAISQEAAPNAWNTFAVGPENTTNSFAFSFAFESYSDMGSSEAPKTLDIRIGASGSWNSGHFYRLVLCNVWGPNGVIRIDEFNNETEIAGKGKSLDCNLKPGARHIIEFGSIYVKDSSDTYDYLKYDDSYLFQIVRTPFNDQRTTKIGISYTSDNVFLGSAYGQRENDSTLTLNSSNSNKGIFLDGPTNNIPVSAWNVRGVPASKYNALLNGQPLYQYGTESKPLAKHGNEATNNYYIAFDDFGITFKEGDVVTIRDEFHFYWDNKAYSMSIVPVHFLFTNGEFTQIDNLSSYLYSALDEHCVRDYYADEQLAEIDAILLEASQVLPAIDDLLELWETYYDYIDQLDLIPWDEEKAKEIIDAAKARATKELEDFVDLDLYDDDHAVIVLGYLVAALNDIEDASSLAQINQIVADAKALISGVPTILQAIEEKILALEDGYEEYLEAYDVVTTTDVCTVGQMGFYSDDRSYGSGNINDFTTRIATSKDNEDGNMIFQFLYSSNDPSSSLYGAQVYIRLRGVDSTCYRFSIAQSMEGGIGVSMCAFVNDRPAEGTETTYNTDFQPGISYRIECGSIDIAGYDRTFIFMKCNGIFIMKSIVDSVSSDQIPTIRILDSRTAPDSDAYALLSPYETGTTKSENALVLGRLKLDNSSSNESLTATARKNDIPVGTNLYPMSHAAFLINGGEVESYRPETYITKISETKYEIHFDYSSLTNENVISLSGYFGAFDEVTVTKTAYKLFLSEFTYHEFTNSWTQTPATLEIAKEEAIETLNHHVDLSDYSDVGSQAIVEVIGRYTDLINDATTVEQVEAFLEDGLYQMSLVPTLLVEYKASAKAELANYKPASVFREEEQVELQKILQEAYANIDNCNDKASIDYVVRLAKAEIDELKTAEQRDAEDLADSKKVTKAELEAYVGLLEMDRYSDENINLIQSLALQARTDIDNAASIEEVQNILAKFKEDIKNVKTLDGTIFDGEKYIQPNSNKTMAWVIPVIIVASVLVVGAAIALVVVLVIKKKH